MTTTAFGKPVEGEVSYFSEVKPDTHTADDFSAALDALFEHFAAVQWTQYTPYFNDGDACTFSVHEAYYFTEEQLERYKEETSDLEWLSSYPDEQGSDVYDLRPEGEYVETGEVLPNGYRRRNFVPNDPDGPEAKLHSAATEFERVQQGVSLLLHKAFGDPATVLATPDGFRVEFCDHE